MHVIAVRGALETQVCEAYAACWQEFKLAIKVKSLRECKIFPRALCRDVATTLYSMKHINSS